MTKMDRRLNDLANTLKTAGCILLLWAALQADTTVYFWLLTAAAGSLFGVLGLCLGWLCSARGRSFRRRLWHTKPNTPAPAAQCPVIPFPKAG